ncbi:hypothetical protein PseudUWO311_10965 [Pseudanabaena sp. UWO311]|uniref:hypothetical protein n=1 Tax=Pseudanabaena sp. UWO311 TaxID=2487337 RepID=UPI00115A3261|nr:hypothetical protein [Pseudanabaena sp. UWO311]TYQ26631.1 hypothetical protein PseudUWO311_10965 [Pseudanabaena sp. UWO311]
MSSSDWRLQPLRNFWQSVNWENRAITPMTSNNGKSAQTLSLLMSVSQYFRAISWTGIPEIAATTPEPKLSSNSIDASNETLEDFLDDISQFF